MAWTTGTATDMADLLVQIRDDVELGNWTRDRYVTAVNDANNDEWIAHATNVTGNDAPYIGIRTYFDSASGAYGLEIAGGTGYNGAGAWVTSIAGISPGRYDGAIDLLRAGAYVPVLDQSMDYWISVTDRRVLCIVQVDTGDYLFHAGLLDAFSDSTAYPFPMYVVGAMNRFNSLPSDTTPDIGCTLADPIAFHNGSTKWEGPGFLRFTDGAWYSVQNSAHRTSGRIAQTDLIVFPAGLMSQTPSGIPDPADRWWGTGSSSSFFSDIIPQTGNPGTPVANLRKTDGTTGNVPIFPATILMQTPSGQFIGEINGVFWCSGADGVGSEDVLGTGTTYRVFQGGTQTNLWRRCAILEA
jgi:hypothetical protein